MISWVPAPLAAPIVSPTIPFVAPNLLSMTSALFFAPPAGAMLRIPTLVVGIHR